VRAQRNQARVDLEIAAIHNKLAAEHRDAAKHQGPRLPTFMLPYCLDKDQLSFITHRFPRTTFRCTSDNMHDHPLAHAETMIATEKAKRMVPEGHLVMDLFGSPSDADKFNRQQRNANVPKHMIPYLCCMTEKDYLRSLEWGSPLHADGSLRYVEGAAGPVADLEPDQAGINVNYAHTGPGLTYLSRHTLYYLTDEEICLLLKPDRSRMLAIVHRHPNDVGKMFAGECSYAKIAGCVEQVNTLTGERYVHRDLSWLWDSKTKVVRTSVGAFTWTFHMVTPDTWIVKLTACPSHMDERFVSRSRVVGIASAAHELNEHALAPTHFPHEALEHLPSATCRMLGSVPLICFDDKSLPPIKFTCPPLFDFLRSNQVGKPRDPDRLHDLFALARSHVSNGSEFPGKRNFDVDPSQIAGHVLLAYISGIKEETMLLRSVESYRVWIKEHKALLDGTAIVVNRPDSAPESAARTVHSVLKRVDAVRKQSSLFTGVLEAFE
jgi:hypothetical protein